MIEESNYTNPIFIDDLSELDPSAIRVAIKTHTKNLSRLRDLHINLCGLLDLMTRNLQRFFPILIQSALISTNY